MLKMKLPQRKSKHTASDEEDEGERLGMCSRPCSLRDCPATNGGRGPGSLQREAVYEWFVRTLGPAQRLEFACGLLDLCNPLELRFLGSCLEDLARKDCHYLRDHESRANSLTGDVQGDLGDAISRSRLIVYLALLSSENRDVAGRFYRLLLPAMDTERLLGGWEQDEEDRESGEELLLLLTMASLHPAFSFHQRVTLRERLEQLREAVHRRSRPEENIHEYLSSSDGHVLDGTIGTHNGVGAAAHNFQQEAVHIESINIKHVQRRRADKNSDYTFEVNWSNNSRTSVTKSYRELLEFLLTLPKELSNENLDKTILEALHLGKNREECHYDLEPIVKQIFSSPSKALLQNQKVFSFFHNIQAEHIHSSNHMQPCTKYCKSQEDSSETSSQEEDITHHTSVYKKAAGKCSVTNFIAAKNSCDGNHVLHGEPNGKDRSKNNSNSEHLGHQRPLDKRSFHPVGRETSDSRTVQKLNGRPVFKANGIKPPPNVKPLTGKDSMLEVGSGHETCGETSSESYSSPPSPLHNRRESFESEEEKDRDTDSNSEDSTKHVFTTFEAVKASTAKLSEHLNNEDSTTETMNNPKCSHFHLMSSLHCVMPSGGDKSEHGLPPSIPSDGKTLGMLVSPVSMSPVRDIFQQGSPGILAPPTASVVGESEKCIDLLPSPLPVPTTFLPRNCQPSTPALHIPVQRMKLPPQGPTESCPVNGSTQTNLGIGTAGAGFISVHSQSPFTVSPLTVSDPVAKPVSQMPSLNQVVPHMDGNAGAVPPASNLKLVLPGTNLPAAPSTLPFPLSAPAIASGVLPSPNTNVLNASASVAATQPTSGGLGQLQSIPPVVPTHSPGPAPSPSPALTHSTAQSDSASFISAAVGNTSTNGALPPPQQMGQGPCGSCGRRCGCGNNGGIPFGSFYYPNPITGQMYTRVSPLFIPSLCNNTYLSQAHQSNGTQFPVFLHQAPPYTNGLMHESVLGGQANYGMQQMASFARLYPMYPATNVVGNANGSVTKKNGNISCYNCGVNGHYAQDCKQPPMEASQQGTFRLRYLPNPSNDSLDSAD